MRKLISFIAVALIAASLGYEFGANRAAPSAVATASASPDKPARKIKYYWDPMLGPSSISDKPGKSAMNMDLVPVYEGDSTDSASSGTGGPAVIIDSAIVQNMGIRTAQVSRGPLQKTLRAVASLEVPETGQYDINLKINGWIKQLYADQEGMAVRKGDPLFDLYSPDVQVAEEELIGAVQSLKSLGPQASTAVRSQSESLIDSAKQKLRRWDIADQDIDAISKAPKAPETVPFRSPADGHIVDKAVVQGSAIQAGMKLMRIENHSQLWLEARVYEADIPLITIGQTVQATVEALPGKVFTGPITFIYPHMDHMNRTALVRVTLDNPTHQLSPGMYATANIIGDAIPDAVWVPREAVIDTGSRQIAFVVRSAGHFEPVEVHLGMIGDDDRAQVLSGLEPGQTVVASGQFLLDVESRTTEAINKLLPASSAGAKP